MGTIALLHALLLALTGDPPQVDAHQTPQIALQVPWGSGGAMIALRDGNESSPEGPMSFAVASSGDVYVLDQVSSRVVHFRPDGSVVGEVALPGDTFQDIEIAPDGRLLVLDRLVRQSVLIADETTGASREVPILGEHISEGGAVTALLARADGVWLELEHRLSVRILDDRLDPCERTVVTGRPSAAAGRTLVAALDGAGGALVEWVSREGAVVQRLPITAEGPIARIAWLEDDARGSLMIALHVVRLDEDGVEVVAEHTEIQTFSAIGERGPVVRSPHVLTEYEQLRELDLGGDGGLYQLAILPDGPQVLRFGRLRGAR